VLVHILLVSVRNDDNNSMALTIRKGEQVPWKLQLPHSERDLNKKRNAMTFVIAVRQLVSISDMPADRCTVAVNEIKWTIRFRGMSIWIGTINA
jgi:hypothetical protein